MLAPKVWPTYDISTELFDGKVWKANFNILVLSPHEISEEWTDKEPILTFFIFHFKFLDKIQSL